jgi:hypothetical protein
VTLFLYDWPQRAKGEGQAGPFADGVDGGRVGLPAETFGASLGVRGGQLRRPGTDFAKLHFAPIFTILQLTIFRTYFQPWNYCISVIQKLYIDKYLTDYLLHMGKILGFKRTNRLQKGILPD